MADCRKCKNYVENADCVECNPNYKTTNADKIRSMSDEELAELLAEKCSIGIEFARCWLQSEAE